MQRRPGGLLLLAFALGLATQATADFSYPALANQAAQQSGEGTYYGAGQDAQGTCSFSSNFANTNGLPWTTGAALTLALNDAQFANGVACGLCVMFKGTGAGLGTVPIPSTYQLGFVNNRCPECSAGDLDLATSGDGRWRIQWYAVPCNVGSTPLTYSIVVSSYYWFSLVVSNTRYPVSDVSVQLGGGWLPLRRSNNNQWAYYNTNGPWQSAFPMPIKITNVLGETVQDTITSPQGNTGTVQFSASGTGGGMPASGGGNATAAASPPALPGSLQTMPAAAPPTVPASPPAVPASPPVAQSPPAVLPDGNFYIEDYQQCGGSGSFCNNNQYTAAPCQDAAWPRATCRASRFACTRYDASLWSCIPNSNITYPPPMVWTAPPTGTPPAQAQAAVQAVPPSSPLPVTAAPPTLPSNLQSQGPAQSLAGTSPPVVPASPPAVVSSPPPVTATPPVMPPSTGTQQAAAVTTTSPSPSPSPPVMASPPASGSTGSPPPTGSSGGSSSGSLFIANGGQCGGTSQCSPPGVPTDKVTCNNGPWSGAYCSSGYSCQPDPGPLIWSCKSASVATGGRRLLVSS